MCYKTYPLRVYRAMRPFAECLITTIHENEGTNVKHRLWQRLVSAVLTAAMVVTMLPLSAFASDTNPPSYTLSYYNYVKLHALSTPVRVLATNYATANKARIYNLLIPGELSYVKFALD